MNIAVEFQGCSTKVSFNKFFLTRWEGEPTRFPRRVDLGNLAIASGVEKATSWGGGGILLLNHLIWADNFFICSES